MNIKSLQEIKFNNDIQSYDLSSPQYIFKQIDFFTYEVQKTEEMRIDLVMFSIYYEDISVLENIDIILYLNGIDNPVNIMEGDIIIYPDYEILDSFRYTIDSSKLNNESVRDIISTPNKTSKIDKNRTKYLENGYSLPPTVLEESKQAVRVEGNKIVFGGI